MKKVIVEKLKMTNRPSWLIASIFLIILLLIIVNQSTQPKRSIEAYCDVYKQEKSRLASYPGSTYSSLVFNKNLNDVGQFVTSFERLEKVAPDEISPAVTNLKSVYKTMKDDPSKTFQAGLSGASAENNTLAWTTEHCGKQ